MVDSDTKKVLGDTVFIVHGHDQLMTTQVQNMLYKAGVSNIVLHEQEDAGRTIFEKLIEESEKANFAIVIFSPDDLLDDGSKQARPNVLLEAGYFIGKLGKKRVRILLKEGVTIPSDLHGVLYERYTEDGVWKAKLCKTLISVGVKADLHGVI